MPPSRSAKLPTVTPTMPTSAPRTASPYPSASPGRRPARSISRESGQLASAVPSAPTATGMPDHVFVPVIPAAMMPPIAIPIECPVLPHTCAANSVAINRPRLDVVRGIVASVSIDSSV